MAKRNVPTSEITSDVIKEWKEEFVEVRKIEVSTEVVKFDPFMVPDENAPIENAKIAYIRKPNSKELSYAMSKLPVVLDAGKVILKSCWLGGDVELKEDEELLTAAAMEALSFLEVHRTKMVKL